MRDSTPSLDLALRELVRDVVREELRAASIPSAAPALGLVAPTANGYLLGPRCWTSLLDVLAAYEARVAAIVQGDLVEHIFDHPNGGDELADLAALLVSAAGATNASRSDMAPSHTKPPASLSGTFLAFKDRV